MSKIYTTLKLMNGDTVTIDEVSGGTLMQAAIMAGPELVKNSYIASMYLFAVCCKKNGQCVGIKYIETLLLDDLNTLIDAVSSQGFKVNGNG